MSGNTWHESTPRTNPIVKNNAIANEEYLTIQLTASSDYIAMGTVDIYRGFAYSDDAADVLRFVDPINDVTLNQSIESGTLEEKTIAGADIDNDDSTEFLILNYNGTTTNLLVVDFNDASTNAYNVSIDGPTGIATGYFNSDTNLDVAVFVRSGSEHLGVITLDIQTGQMLGNFSFSGFEIDCYAIGNFLESSQDSIAMGLYTSSKDGNLTIIGGNGTILRTKMMHTEIFGIARFDYGSGLDDLAAMMFDGNLTAINPDTMTAIFNTTGHPERSFVTTGFLNHDTQEDLVIVPTQKNYSVYIDGTDGTVIRQTEEISGAMKGPSSGDPPSPLLNYGLIDADNLTDYALLSADGGDVGFLRGNDGTYGYIEPTISNKPGQILTYDINANSRDDIIVLQSQTVYILLSDTQPPIIIPEPLSPPHPTIHDDYIEIEVSVEDNTSIILADIYLRYEEGNWTQPIEEMQNSGNKYFAFLVGLPEGYYEYFLEFQDTYLNLASVGNATHPMNFTVAGHLAWTASKYEDSGLNHHLMDIGNNSDGGEVIYTLDSLMDEVYLDRYTPRGDNETIALVANRTFSDFWIYTGMMDGDNVLDPVVLLYNSSSRTINVSIYHGSSGSLWFSSQHPLNLTIPHSPQTFDCDNDGIEEFFFISEHYFNWSYAPAYLIQLDASGEWSNVSLTGSDAETYGLSLAKTINQNSVEACVSASTGPIDIINATSMTKISTHNVTSTEYSVTVPVSPYAYHNGSGGSTRFLLYLYLIDGLGYSMGYHVFDASTQRINETPLFTIRDIIYMDPTLIDVDSDGTDEIIGLNYFSDEVSLIALGDPVEISWSVPVSISDYLSSVVVDFDGDGEKEYGVFTKQDERLTIVSFDGIIERVMTVGQGYGSMPLSNIDLGYGEEIVSYPLIQNGVTKIGVIRDIVLIRRLNASLTYSTREVLQGDSLIVSVDVTNIYSEVINDAEVFVTIHYPSGNTIINQTKALIFGGGVYSTSITANWPMGIVNFSVTVNHPLYDPFEEYYSNALTVTSPLDVIVYTREIVMQGSTFLPTLL
jgi:hypothetical protein